MVVSVCSVHLGLILGYGKYWADIGIWHTKLNGSTHKNGIVRGEWWLTTWFGGTLVLEKHKSLLKEREHRLTWMNMHEYTCTWVFYGFLSSSTVAVARVLGSNAPLHGIEELWTWGVVTYEPYSQQTQGFGQQESGCVIGPTTRETQHAQPSGWLGCASRFTPPRNHGSILEWVGTFPNAATTVECMQVDRWHSHLCCFHHNTNVCSHPHNCHLAFVFSQVVLAHLVFTFLYGQSPFVGSFLWKPSVFHIFVDWVDARRNLSGLRLKNVFVSSM